LWAVSVCCSFFGFGSLLVNQSNGDPTTTAWVLFTVGALTLIYMIVGWVRDVINESRAGLYDAQMDGSFRQGMAWFIFPRLRFCCPLWRPVLCPSFAVPWLGGEGAKGAANMLWQGFEAQWPLINNPDSSAFKGPTP